MSAPAAWPDVPPRAPVGSARETRAQLLSQRPRPFLVALYAAAVGDGGWLGRDERRWLGRLLVRCLPALLGAAVAALLVRSVFAAPRLGPLQAAAAGALLAAIAGAAWRRARLADAGRTPSSLDQLELGALLVLAAFALAQAGQGTGPGADAPLYPVVYLAVAGLVAFVPRPVGLALALLAVGLDAAAWGGRGAPPEDVPVLAAHAAFLLLFALLHHVLLAARVLASRSAERSAVDRRLREIEERAREFRLIAPLAGSPGDAAERERLFAGASVLEIEAAVRGVLEVAEVALRAHTAALYVLSPDERELRLRECRSRSERVARGPLPAGDGPLGGAVKRRAAVRLCGDLRGAALYDDGTRPGALLATPLLDRRGGHVRGVLVVDRIEAAAFSPEDERLLGTLAGELLRAVEGERILADLKRARDEKERFFQAIEHLNRAHTRADVVASLLAVAGEMVELQFAAVTLCEPDGGRTRHRVVRCSLPQAEGGAGPLQGLAFGDNPGLVAQAVKLGATLPGRDLDLEKAIVFDEGTRLRGLSALKVIPLRASDRVLGTLVVGRRRGELPAGEVRELEVVALQAGASLERAELFERTEALATTDGLTGLLNHRTFQQRFEERLGEAQRYGKKLAVLLTDIDHFKKVNDGHGHPVGDRVLAGVARLLAREARTTDLAARYGGEEFALVLPETDAEGARVIAERIRERVAAEVFETEQGPLRVTISLGVAAFPADGQQKAQLVELADGALYAAKRGGRNRSVTAASLKAARRAGPAGP